MRATMTVTFLSLKRSMRSSTKFPSRSRTQSRFRPPSCQSAGVQGVAAEKSGKEIRMKNAADATSAGVQCFIMDRNFNGRCRPTGVEDAPAMRSCQRASTIRKGAEAGAGRGKGVAGRLVECSWGRVGEQTARTDPHRPRKMSRCAGRTGYQLTVWSNSNSGAGSPFSGASAGV